MFGARVARAAVVVHAPDTSILWANDEAARLLGIQHDALEGNSWREHVHPDDQRRVQAAFEEHLERGTPFDVRYRVRLPEGGWRHIHARGRAEWDGSGRPTRIAGAISDVTAQVDAEATRRAMDASFEASARMESLAVLAGGVAHDFNNLLTGVLGAADAARSELDDLEAVKDYLSIVVESAQRAAGLTRQLLAYAGGAPLTMQRVDVGELVVELARLMRGALPHDATVEVSVAPDTPAVSADPTQLHQVVLNLLVNACQAVKPGGGVRVRTGRRTLRFGDLARAVASYGDPGDYTVVQVEDDGCGMAPETVRRVFEPFFTTKPDGHGLGLAAVHGLVRTHSGYVHVGAPSGRGLASSWASPCGRLRGPLCRTRRLTPSVATGCGRCASTTSPWCAGCWRAC